MQVIWQWALKFHAGHALLSVIDVFASRQRLHISHTGCHYTSKCLLIKIPKAAAHKCFVIYIVKDLNRYDLVVVIDTFFNFFACFYGLKQFTTYISS